MGDFVPRDDKDRKMANAANLQNGLEIFGPRDQHGVIKHVDANSYMDALHQILNQPITYSGRTQAKIKDGLPRVYDENGENFVLKNNDGDERTSIIEEKIMRMLRASGHDVPEIYARDGDRLVIEKIRGILLQYATTHILNVCRIGADKDNGEKAMQEFGAIIDKSINASVGIDSKINEILSDEDKKYLSDKKSMRLADKFKADLEQIEANIDAYRIMESLDFYDDKFIELFKPLQERLNYLKEKYGRWVVSPSTTNIIIKDYERSTKGDKAENIVVTDFNHANFAPTQLSIFYLIDGFMPLKNFNSTISETTPISLEDKLLLTDRFFELWKNINPEVYNNSVEYRFGQLAIAIPESIRQIGHACKDVDNAKNFYIYYDCANEVGHYATKCYQSLEILSMPQTMEIPELRIDGIKELGEYLKKRIIDYTTLHIKEDDYAKAIEYMNWS